MEWKSQILAISAVVISIIITESNCTSKIKLKQVFGCSTTEQEAKTFIKSVRRRYRFGIVDLKQWYASGNFSVIIRDKKTNKTQYEDHNERFTVMPFAIPPGSYSCHFSYTQLTFRNTYQFDWHLMVSGTALTTITGGSYRTFPEKNQLLLSPDDPLLESVEYAFEWSCTQKLTTNTFCGKTWNTKELIVPSGQVAKGDEFAVTLKVTYEGAVREVKQVVVVVGSDTADLRVRCLENCSPITSASNIDSRTRFVVACIANCAGIKSSSYEWTISEAGGGAITFDYAKNTEYGRNSHLFYLKRGVLQPKSYTFSVKLTGGKSGEGRRDATFQTGPTLGNCYSIPPVGMPHKTMFTFFCEQANEQEVYFYELVAEESADNETLIVSGRSPDIFQYNFKLDSMTAKYFVRMYAMNEDSVYGSKQLPVVITEKIRRKTPQRLVSLAKDLMGNPSAGGKSMIKLLESQVLKERYLGKKMFTFVIRDMFAWICWKIEHMSDYAMMFVVVGNSVHDFLKLPGNIVEDIMKICESVIDLLVKDQYDKAEVTTKTLCVPVCQQVAVWSLHFYKELGFKDRIEAQGIETAQVLSECITDDKHTFNTTDVQRIEPKLTDFCVVEQKTPDKISYRVDKYKSLEALEEATINSLNTSALLARMYALTTAKFKKLFEVSVDTSNIVIANDTGTILAETTVVNRAVALKPSRDLAKDMGGYNIYLSTWDQDILWWNCEGQNISTDICLVEVWRGDQQIHNFNDPVTLTMPLKDSTPRFKYTDSFTFPMKLESELDIHRAINVRRVYVPGLATLRVIFHKLKTDQAFLVVTLDRYPDHSDFQKSAQNINASSTLALYNSKVKTTTVAYIGVLPANLEQRAKTSAVIDYQVSYQLSACVKFELNSYKWKTKCHEEARLNHTHISCKCSHLSVLGGNLTDTPAEKLELVEDNIQLKLQSCQVIFLTVTATYIVYCIFSIFANWKKKEAFYFLSDNLKRNKYFYLVIIRTNTMMNSGTTSNVMIKIIGQKASSLPHVLNYPDPHGRLLQRFGEDTFVLATESSLGTITKLELWYNCIGSSPAYNVREIIVYDMQESQEWYFFIDRRLYVVSGITSMTAEPLKPDEKINQTIWKRIRICGEFHSWFLFSNQEKFAYMKRLTVVLSTILTNFSLSLSFHGAPNMTLQDTFDSYEKLIVDGTCVGIAFSSSIISFVVHISLAWIFRNSRIQFSRRKQQIAQLSYRVTIACWAFLIVNIVVCTSYLLVCGFWVAHYKSLSCLVSGLMGVGCEIFIYDNLVVMIHSFFTQGRLMVDIANKAEIIMSNIQEQRKYLFDRFGDSIYRPYFQHLYTPSRPDEMLDKKIIVQHRRAIANQLLDAVCFTTYFILLCFMILTMRNKNTLESKRVLEDMMKGEFTRTMSFEDIQTTEDIYDFINDTLLQVLHPSGWYGTYPLKDSVLMADMSNTFIGVARIRQHRTTVRKCNIWDSLSYLFTICKPEYSAESEETDNFDYRWKNYSNSSFVQSDRLGGIWSFSEDDGATVKGQFDSYPDGGYTAYLSRSDWTSYVNFRAYKQQSWIDQRTRCVIMELLTYSANSNMFNAVSLIYEQSATGFIKKTITSRAAKMLVSDNEDDRVQNAAFILYHICVAGLAFKHTFRIIFSFKTVFKNVWFLIDLALSVLNIATLIVYYTRESYINTFDKELKKSEYMTFINYFYMFDLHELFNILTAFVLTIATLRLWQLLHFGLIFRIMERTLALACVPLLAATLAFFVVLMAFGFAGILLLGREFTEFYSFMNVARTLVTMALKPDQFDIRDFLILDLVYPFFTVYLLLMQVILFVYIIIIIMAYMKAQIEFSVIEESYTLKHFLGEKIKEAPRFVKGMKVRIMGGAPKKEIVVAKADEFRYANCVSIEMSSLQKMRLLTKCFLRKIRKRKRVFKELSDDDMTLMLQICQDFVFYRNSEDDDKVFFYKGHFAGEATTLIDEKRVLTIESVVRAMFSEKGVSKKVYTKSAAHRRFEECAAKIKDNGKILWRCDVKLRKLVMDVNKR